MSAASHANGAKANLPGANSCREIGKGLPLISALMRVARGLYPNKTGAALADTTGRSERMCRYWLSERYDLSVDDLASLLRSDDGLKFLQALMGDARPVWWRGFKRTMQLAELRRQQEEQRKNIERLEQEAAE